MTDKVGGGGGGNLECIDNSALKTTMASAQTKLFVIYWWHWSQLWQQKHPINTTSTTGMPSLWLIEWHNPSLISPLALFLSLSSQACVELCQKDWRCTATVFVEKDKVCRTSTSKKTVPKATPAPGHTAHLCNKDLIPAKYRRNKSCQQLVGNDGLNHYKIDVDHSWVAHTNHLVTPTMWVCVYVCMMQGTASVKSSEFWPLWPCDAYSIGAVHEIILSRCFHNWTHDSGTSLLWHLFIHSSNLFLKKVLHAVRS